MKDRIEVGEYIRTKNGEIGVFDRYSSRKENSLYKSPFNCFIKIRNRKTPLQCCEDYIAKHSKQLIELIESGDLIIYRLRGLKHQSEGFIRIHKDARSGKEKLGIDSYSLEQIEIIKILTHEQIEQNCYKVGGEDGKIQKSI